MRLVLVLSLLVLAACPTTTPAAGEVLCGAGTTLQGSTCVATSAGATCGAGTVLSGTECVPAGTSITCGPGTTLTNGQCVSTGTTVTCGAGTTLTGTTCVANAGAVTCGTGTVLNGSQCIVNPSTKKGFRDSCVVNADCGCYANMADDPTCTVSGNVKLICKSNRCTVDCTSTPVCTGVFPGGTICNSSNYCY